MLYRCWEDIPGGGKNRHFQLVLLARLVCDVLEGLHNFLVEEHLGERKSWRKFLLARSEKRVG